MGRDVNSGQTLLYQAQEGKGREEAVLASPGEYYSQEGRDRAGP